MINSIPKNNFTVFIKIIAKEGGENYMRFYFLLEVIKPLIFSMA